MFTVKCMLIGDAGVGKTSLVHQMERKRFDPHYDYTIGVDFIFKPITLDTGTVRLQIYDTAGQEKFHSVARHYYHNAAVVCIVYDVSQRTSFEHVPQWMSKVHTYCSPHTPVFLVANKQDLTPQVTTQEGQRMAQSWGAQFVETAAKDYFSTNILFFQVAQLAAKKSSSSPRTIHYAPLPSEETETKRFRWLCCF